MPRYAQAEATSKLKDDDFYKVTITIRGSQLKWVRENEFPLSKFVQKKLKKQILNQSIMDDD